MKGFKGIILSGGTGSRFYPVTKSISKQLLAIFNKPMIYYSLSILMMMGIRNILIIVRPDEKKLYQKLLKSGLSLGVKIDYAVQKKPGGIAQSLIIGKKFIGKSNIALILGDNFFYNDNLQNLLMKALKNNKTQYNISKIKTQCLYHLYQ
jgi:glucose-1-phosphate thymidylyltransferase